MNKLTLDEGRELYARLADRARTLKAQSVQDLNAQQVGRAALDDADFYAPFNRMFGNVSRWVDRTVIHPPVTPLTRTPDYRVTLWLGDRQAKRLWPSIYAAPRHGGAHDRAS